MHITANSFCRGLIALAATVLLSGAPARAEPLTVLLDWFVNPDHAPLIVAQDRGFFAEVGLEVELIEPADPNDPPKLVAAGQAPLAVTYQPMLHLQAEAGLPLARIATLIATPLNSLVSLADGPVQAMSDLKGRRVGYSIGGMQETLLRRMLENSGLELDDVELINVNFALSPALLTGRVDAVIGAFRNFELNQLELEGQAGRAFYPEEEGVPAYDELIIVANSNALDDPRLPAFLEALERGVQYLINHPEESWEIFVAYDEGLDDDLNRRAWWDTLPRFALRPGAADIGRYERFARFLEESGVVEALPPVTDYVTELDR